MINWTLSILKHSAHQYTPKNNKQTKNKQIKKQGTYWEKIFSI